MKGRALFKFEIEIQIFGVRETFKWMREYRTETEALLRGFCQHCPPLKCKGTMVYLTKGRFKKNTAALVRIEIPPNLSLTVVLRRDFISFVEA